MRSKFEPLVRIDVRLDQLLRVHISEDISREIFESVAVQSTKVCAHHGEWHGSVYAIVSEEVDIDGITKPIKNDNPLVEGILEERHSYLNLDAENELTDKMKDDLHDIMVSANKI